MGGIGFTDKLVTVVFTGDTGDVVGHGHGFFSDSVGTATVTVDGFATATFTDVMEAFDNQNFSLAAAGIADTTSGSVLDTFNGTFLTSRSARIWEPSTCSRREIRPSRQW